jgi:hypothetical protein
MKQISLDEVLRSWSQSPSAAAAGRTLGMSRRTLSNRWQSASREEVLQALAQIVASYERQLAEERQARLQERVTAQAQLKAVRKAHARERSSLKRKLATRSNTLERFASVLRTVGARTAVTEGTVDQQQKLERLAQENQLLREELERLNSIRPPRPQGPGNGPVLRRTSRPIILDDSTSI